MHYYKLALAGILFTIILSCANELLPELEIVEISVPNGFVHAEKLNEIKIVFSQEPKKATLENSFSLLGNGALLRGRFSYAGKTVTFIPFKQFTKNVDYELLVTQNVETSNGISLDKKYTRKFSTRKELVPPRVKATVPSCGEIVLPEICELQVDFSEPILSNCIFEAIEFNPPFEYLHLLEENGCVLHIFPKKNLRMNTTYLFTIKQDLVDYSENKLTEPYRTFFLTGQDMLAPDYTVSCSFDEEESVTLTENINTQIGNNVKIKLAFDEEISEASIASRIFFYPNLDATITCNKENHREVIISFSQQPAWQYNGSLIIENGISDTAGNRTQETRKYPISVNMEKFRPVIVHKAFIETGCEKDLFAIAPQYNYTDLILPAEWFPQNETVTSVLYVVVSVSNNAKTISHVSAMNGITISPTNMCVTIRMRSVDVLSWDDSLLDTFRTVVEKDTDLNFLDKKKIVIRIKLEVENTLDRGIIEYTVKDLRDDLGNTSNNVWKVFINKG